MFLGHKVIIMKLLLIDNDTSNYDFLVDGFDEVVYSPSRQPKILGWIVGAWRAIRKTPNKTDTIVCWFDFQAILVYYFTRICLSRRRIVCINIMLKDKHTLLNRLVTRLYACALHDRNLVATVTSLSYGAWLDSKLNGSYRFTLLHDVYHRYYEIETSPADSPYIFCGGRNGRDWELMYQIAKRMPNVAFRFVLSPNDIVRHRFHELHNVTVMSDLPPQEFLHELSCSRAVCLPLDTIAPAGLIVMFQAAANLRPVLMTETITTSEYITPDRGYPLGADPEQWCSSIQYVLSDADKARQKAIALRTFLQEQCSEQVFCRILANLIVSNNENSSV